MKILLLAVFFLLTGTIWSYGQQMEQNGLSVYLRSGLIQQNTTDQLLNYYNYSGNTIPVNLYSSYVKKKTLLTLNLLYQSGRLDPINLSNNFYAYNYIQHRDTELNLEYFREIGKLNKYLQAYIGIRNCSYFTRQRQDFKNLLYGDSDEFRKSYDASALSLSPVLLINFSLRKNDLALKAGHSLLHYAARPDDNYVKQTGLESKRNWDFYSPKEYKNIFFSTAYQYKISRGFGFMAEYAASYRRYSYDRDYKYLRFSYLVGIGKTF